MRKRRILPSVGAMILLLVLTVGLTQAQGPQPQGETGPLALVGTAFTYQGQLKRGGNPVDDTCDFQFSLWDAASGGTQIGTSQNKTGVQVTDGLFTIPDLDFGVGAFQGDARWLQIAVKCTGDADYTTLMPRQALTAAPYALYARSAWSLTGNSGTTPGTNFLGTTDNQALEFKVNGQRALRLEPNATSPNLIGGYSGNSVNAGVVGATIGGGGYSGVINQVTANYGTVGGGSGNTASDTGATVGGGSNNTASGWNATVAGGGGNTASNTNATVGGGYGNVASGGDATVAGGRENTASHHAAVGGGENNTASGSYATVPGGRDNTAQGNYSFAAGRRAKANHTGAFVWADSTDADFSSTAVNQFAVRATGGVAFTTGSAGFLINGNTVWHAGNDGHDSGLDADTLDGQHASAFASAALLGSSYVYEGSTTQEQLFSMSTTGWTVLTDGDSDWDHTLIIKTTTTIVEYTLWYGGTVVHGEASSGSPATITFPHYQGFQLILARYQYIASLVCNENDGLVACVYQKSDP